MRNPIHLQSMKALQKIKKSFTTSEFIRRVYLITKLKKTDGHPCWMTELKAHGKVIVIEIKSKKGLGYAVLLFPEVA